MENSPIYSQIKNPSKVCKQNHTKKGKAGSSLRSLRELYLHSCIWIVSKQIPSDFQQQSLSLNPISIRFRFLEFCLSTQIWFHLLRKGLLNSHWPFLYLSMSVLVFIISSSVASTIHLYHRVEASASNADNKFW